MQDQTSNLQQQLELVGEHESDLRDTVGDGGVGEGQETQLDSFDRSNNTDAIDLKMNGSALK